MLLFIAEPLPVMAPPQSNVGRFLHRLKIVAWSEEWIIT